MKISVTKVMGDAAKLKRKVLSCSRCEFDHRDLRSRQARPDKPVIQSGATL